MTYTEEEVAGLQHLASLREDPIFEQIFQAYVKRQRFREPEIETALLHLSYFVADDLLFGELLEKVLRTRDRNALFGFYRAKTPLDDEVVQRLRAYGVMLQNGSLNPYFKPYLELHGSL